MSPDVVVLGSANLDLVYVVPTIPRPGETVLATGQSQHCGGKGLNQAIAAARAGATTSFIGAVGSDDAGAVLADAMRRTGVECTALRTTDTPTGTAVITVQDSGENVIVVGPGANATVNSLTGADQRLISSAKVLVAQLEVPLSAVAQAAAAAKSRGTTMVLNAAPAQRLDDELLRTVDILVVNEHEASTLADVVDPLAAAHVLTDRCRTVMVTLGARGAASVSADGPTEHVPAPAADVVDTTGAGDAFLGYLAAGLAAGLRSVDAMRRAVLAGTLSVERSGAEPSIPVRAEVDSRAETAC